MDKILDATSYIGGIAAFIIIYMVSFILLYFIAVSFKNSKRNKKDQNAKN